MSKLEELDIKVNGNSEDNKDSGLVGVSQNHESRISSLEKDKKVVSGFMLVVFMAVFTYFFSILTDGNNTSNNDNNSHDMGNDSYVFRGSQPDNNTNNK